MDTPNNNLMKLSLKNPKIPLVQLINKWSNIEPNDQKDSRYGPIHDPEIQERTIKRLNFNR